MDAKQAGTPQSITADYEGEASVKAGDKIWVSVITGGGGRKIIRTLVQQLTPI